MRCFADLGNDRLILRFAHIALRGRDERDCFDIKRREILENCLGGTEFLVEPNRVNLEAITHIFGPINIAGGRNRFRLYEHQRLS